MSTWRWRSYSCRTLNLPWQSCRGVRSRGRWGRQRHSHGSHPANNFSVGTLREPANRARREWVGQQQQMPVLQLAPSASIAIAQFHKINGAIEFGTPTHRLDFAHARVNLHKRARTKQRIEGHVLKPDVSVEAVADVEVLDVDTVEEQEVGKLEAVDGAETI